MKTQNLVITEHLKKGVANEAKQAIAAAQHGLLSPYWQEYHLRSLTSYKGTPYYPENGDMLEQLLRSAIANRQQITDIQHTKRELALTGSELLFFYMQDHGSVIEISYCLKSHLFSCDIGIDDDLDLPQKKQRIADMKSALLCWVNASGTAFNDSSNHHMVSSNHTETFVSLTDTLHFLFTELDLFLNS